MVGATRKQLKTTQSAPQITVVIPTYQRCGLVLNLLRTLTAQTIAANSYEVIVVVDGSDDGTQEQAMALQTPYSLQALWQPNRGRAAACNRGIYAAQGELIVLLDDDMEPTPELLAAHSQAHQASPNVALLGAVPIRRAGGVSSTSRYIGARFGQHLVKLAQPNYQPQLRDFYTGNFSVRRATLLAVGVFDERFRIYGNEDLELCLRLRAAGVTVRYDAAAIAYQHYTKDFVALARDNFAKGQTAVLLAHKHPLALPELKLGAFDQGSYRWRRVRQGLLRLSQRWTALPQWIIRSVSWLERWLGLPMERWYGLTFDYLYWAGVQRALREMMADGAAFPGLAELAEKVHE